MELAKLIKNKKRMFILMAIFAFVVVSVVAFLKISEYHFYEKYSDKVFVLPYPPTADRNIDDIQVEYQGKQIKLNYSYYGNFAMCFDMYFRESYNEKFTKVGEAFIKVRIDDTEMLIYPNDGTSSILKVKVQDKKSKLFLVKTISFEHWLSTLEEASNQKLEP